MDSARASRFSRDITALELPIAAALARENVRKCDILIFKIALLDDNYRCMNEGKNALEGMVVKSDLVGRLNSFYIHISVKTSKIQYQYP
jgi:hypothetical protein